MNIKKHKGTLQLLCAIFLIALGSALLIAGFIMPPPGEIHNSVLIAFGEILTFSGALFGIDYHYKYKVGSSENSDSPTSTKTKKPTLSDTLNSEDYEED